MPISQALIGEQTRRKRCAVDHAYSVGLSHRKQVQQTRAVRAVVVVKENCVNLKSANDSQTTPSAHSVGLPSAIFDVLNVNQAHVIRIASASVAP